MSDYSMLSHKTPSHSLIMNTLLLSSTPSTPFPPRLRPHRLSSLQGSRMTSRPVAVTAQAVTTANDEGLKKGIAEFYDESSGVWENIWGDHMHHGYYQPSTEASLADHRAAQIRMVEEALSFAGVSGSRTGHELRQGIAELYDESAGLWEKLWGDHMHHGFYEPSQPVTDLSHHRQAQVRLIEETLAFAGMTSDDPQKKPKTIVDVGCGIGGSSRYLAKKYGAQCQGITLSPVQAQRARALAAAEGLADKVSFQVADALQQPFPDGQFDLVWSMESGEHMPDKAKFVSELARVAAPGATIIIVTWCHRDLLPSEESLKPDEISLLNKICDAYYLPAWCSAADYVKIAESLSLENIKTGDWSENVAPFWPAVIRSVFTWQGFTSLLRSGWKTIRGALVMPLMIQGYKKNLIKFAIITAQVPQ